MLLWAHSKIVWWSQYNSTDVSLIYLFIYLFIYLLVVVVFLFCFFFDDLQECLWGEHLSSGHHSVRNSAVLSSYSRLVGFFVFFVINNPTSIDECQDIVRPKIRALDRYKSLAVCYVDLLCFFICKKVLFQKINHKC